MCESSVMLTGFTNVIAQPGMGKELLSMAATMPGTMLSSGCFHLQSFVIKANSGSSSLSCISLASWHTIA